MRRLAPTLCFLLLALAAPASAEVRTETFRHGPIEARGYEVKQENVTLADGPRGFSSQHLSGGRTYAKRLSAPGTYKLFCGLHPVSMTQTVRVRR